MLILYAKLAFLESLYIKIPLEMPFICLTALTFTCDETHRRSRTNPIESIKCACNRKHVKWYFA